MVYCEFSDLDWILIDVMVLKCAFIQLSGDSLLKGGKIVFLYWWWKPYFLEHMEMSIKEII